MICEWLFSSWRIFALMSTSSLCWAASGAIDAASVRAAARTDARPDMGISSKNASLAADPTSVNLRLFLSYIDSDDHETRPADDADADHAARRDGGGPTRAGGGATGRPPGCGGRAHGAGDPGPAAGGPRPVSALGRAGTPARSVTSDETGLPLALPIACHV